MLIRIHRIEQDQRIIRIFVVYKQRYYTESNYTMATNNINWKILKDDKVVLQLGKELRRMRLERNLSQAEVAKRAGLDRTTVVKLEAGRAATVMTVVQVLRAMDRLEVLDGFHEEPQLTPYQVVEQQAKYLKKQRKRASRNKPEIVPPKPKSTW